VIRLVKTLICISLAAAAAQAQLTTSHVKVLVTGRDCDKLKDVSLVINGDDLEDHWIKLEPAGVCRWKAELGDGTISTSIARFSLRGSLARSGCQKASANETELSANLEFSCCLEGPSHNVKVKVEPAMRVSYLRHVRPFARDRISDIPCLEMGTFDQGQGAIGNAQFGGEDVYLHLGPFDRKRETLGLLLNDIVADHGAVVLTRDNVVYRLIVQRAKGKTPSAPTLSSNAISLDIKKLGELKFERAEIEVIK